MILNVHSRGKYSSDVAEFLTIIIRFAIPGFRLCPCPKPSII